MKIFACLLALTWAHTVFAFGDLGHKTVAALAWPQLTPFAKQNVERLLGVGEAAFIDASVWADHIKSDERFNYLKPLHYVNMPKAAKQYKKTRDCKKDACVVEAIKRFKQIANSGSDIERTLSLRMLIHLIADIHQPLHAGLYEDRGGNWYEVSFNGEPMSLHKLWDHGLLKALNQDWRELSNTLAATPSQARLAGPVVWAEESHLIAVNEVYQVAENSAVSPAYQANANKILEAQLVNAGWRLAMVLNKLW